MKLKGNPVMILKVYNDFIDISHKPLSLADNIKFILSSVQRNARAVPEIIKIDMNHLEQPQEKVNSENLMAQQIVFFLAFKTD